MLKSKVALVFVGLVCRLSSGSLFFLQGTTSEPSLDTSTLSPVQEQAQLPSAALVPQLPLTNCYSESEFLCHVSSRCIPRRWLCDGARDCADGEDERQVQCDQQSGSSPCFGNQPECVTHDGSRRCIMHAWRCDGHPDCADGSDEFNCTKTVGIAAEVPLGVPCTPVEYRCSSGQCISRMALCDNKPDCSDGSDESDFECASPKDSLDSMAQVFSTSASPDLSEANYTDPDSDFDNDTESTAMFFAGVSGIPSNAEQEITNDEGTGINDFSETIVIQFDLTTTTGMMNSNIAEKVIIVQESPSTPGFIEDAGPADTLETSPGGISASFGPFDAPIAPSSVWVKTPTSDEAPIPDNSPIYPIAPSAVEELSPRAKSSLTAYMPVFVGNKLNVSEASDSLPSLQLKDSPAPKSEGFVEQIESGGAGDLHRVAVQTQPSGASNGSAVNATKSEAVHPTITVQNKSEVPAVFSFHNLRGVFMKLHPYETTVTKGLDTATLSISSSTTTQPVKTRRRRQATDESPAKDEPNLIALREMLGIDLNRTKPLVNPPPEPFEGIPKMEDASNTVVQTSSGRTLESPFDTDNSFLKKISKTSGGSAVNSFGQPIKPVNAPIQPRSMKPIVPKYSEHEKDDENRKKTQLGSVRIRPVRVEDIGP